MKIKDVSIETRPYGIDSVTTGQIWTNRGFTVNSHTVLHRPECVPLKDRGRRLYDMTVIVNDADREHVEYIVADYGKYPENHERIITP